MARGGAQKRKGAEPSSDSCCGICLELLLEPVTLFLRALLLLRGARSGSTQRLPLLSAACEGGSYAIGSVQSAISRPEDETAGTATYAFVDLVSTRINNSSRAH